LGACEKYHKLLDGAISSLEKAGHLDSPELQMKCTGALRLAPATGSALRKPIDQIGGA
jgi:hypothetical protein